MVRRAEAKKSSGLSLDKAEFLRVIISRRVLSKAPGVRHPDADPVVWKEGGER